MLLCGIVTRAALRAAWWLSLSLALGLFVCFDLYAQYLQSGCLRTTKPDRTRSEDLIAHGLLAPHELLDERSKRGNGKGSLAALLNDDKDEDTEHLFLAFDEKPVPFALPAAGCSIPMLSSPIQLLETTPLEQIHQLFITMRLSHAFGSSPLQHISAYFFDLNMLQ